MQCAEVRIVVLNDRLSSLADGITNVAEARGQIKTNVRNRLTIFAAAVRQLTRQSIGILHLSNAHIVNRLLQAKARLHNILINAVHLVQLIITERADAVFNAVEHALNIGVIEAILNFCAGRRSAAGVTAIKAVAPAKPTITKTAKQGQQNNPGPPAASKSVITIVAIAVNSRDVRNTRSIRTTEHSASSFL